jgi:hypothetical protein
LQAGSADAQAGSSVQVAIADAGAAIQISASPTTNIRKNPKWRTIGLPSMHIRRNSGNSYNISRFIRSIGRPGRAVGNCS